MLTISDHFLEILYLKVFFDVGNIATAWEILQRRWKYCNDFFALYRCNISNPSVYCHRGKWQLSGRHSWAKWARFLIVLTWHKGQHCFQTQTDFDQEIYFKWRRLNRNSFLKSRLFRAMYLIFCAKFCVFPFIFLFINRISSFGVRNLGLLSDGFISRSVQCAVGSDSDSTVFGAGSKRYCAHFFCWLLSCAAVYLWK